ncbi:hypothetical protein CEXT_746181 [Caerostris extrusa]|uniref:Uncharacterized protein n=1 Tax=Caerostris extrusa TaxID=172846 RepID=A0AAV4SYS6_CAEEX|nr:hypothetical protein CEXT_746181 [Caerostris extrusa]
MSPKNPLTHFLANISSNKSTFTARENIDVFPKRILPLNFVTSFPLFLPSRARASQQTTNEAERYFKTGMNRKIPHLLCCAVRPSQQTTNEAELYFKTVMNRKLPHLLLLYVVATLLPQIAGEKDPANTQSRLGKARKKTSSRSLRWGTY